MGNRRPGFMHRNCFSRLSKRLVSSHARKRGPSVAGIGAGSRIVRWRVPPRAGRGVAELVEKLDVTGDVGETGEGDETRVLWHSFSTEGMDEAGRRDGIEKALIETKLFEAYGS